MAIGVAELKRELRAAGGLTEFPEIHQFLDGFYLSRIGIRILIGQHIALHEPQKENHIGALRAHALAAEHFIDFHLQTAVHKPRREETAGAQRISVRNGQCDGLCKPSRDASHLV